MVQATEEDQGTTAKSICTKLLMNTVKRDVSSVEASYELTGLPLFRCSHHFQSVSLTGTRRLEKSRTTLTKQTPLDKYLARDSDDSSSWYQFICKTGKVPVISGASTVATWPLNTEYCRTMLLLHTPKWRSTDVAGDPPQWQEIMHKFLASDICPNFVKADVERARRCIDPEPPIDQQVESDIDADEQPEWMSVVQPNCNFETTDTVFNDGGPDCDWTQTSLNYPADLDTNWMLLIRFCIYESE